MLGTIRKANQVLTLFDRDNPEWGVTAVAATLKIAKSSAYALMNSMNETGLLRRTPRGRYRLGWQLLSLSNVLLSTTDLRAQAHNVMERLHARFGETVNLGVWEEGDIVYLDKIEGTRDFKIAETAVGARLPGTTTALGKVLLASRPRAEVEDFIRRERQRTASPRTLAGLEGVEAELEKVRVAGCAYDLGETVDDVNCVAGPITNYLGDVIAAMSLSAPASRFRLHRQTYTSAIIEAAHAITGGDEVWWQAARGGRGGSTVPTG